MREIVLEEASAVYSFSGVESVAGAAAETQNPRQNIPKACKGVFARVLSSTIQQSSSTDYLFQATTQNSITNQALLVRVSLSLYSLKLCKGSAIRRQHRGLNSAGLSSNQSMLAGTRTMYGLASNGQAPKIFLKTWKEVWRALGRHPQGVLTVIYWFLNLTAAGTHVSWMTIF